MKGDECFAGVNGDSLLREDGSRIQLLRHALNSDTGFLFSGENCVMNGRGAAKMREKRGMDVDGGDLWPPEKFLGEDLTVGDGDEEVGAKLKIEN